MTYIWSYHELHPTIILIIRLKLNKFGGLRLGFSKQKVLNKCIILI
jgi:hypothetical protein